MAADDALWGSLSRAAIEAGRAVRGAAEEAAKDLSGALGCDQQRLRWPTGLLGGPTIPQTYTAPWEAGRRLTWQDGYMASCALSVARSLQQQELSTATVGLVAAQAALHMRPGGYRLLQVGLNTHRVLHHGEYRRLLTGVMLHADMTHLVSNCTSVVLEGLPLERRLGSPAFLALVASTSLTSQGLYLLSTRLAVRFLPNSSLANDYYLSFVVGFSGIALALRVVGGYMREADLAAAQVAPSEEFVLTAGRLAAWPSLLMSHALFPNASLTGHLCGIATGVLHVYAARVVGWLARRLGLRRGRRRIEGGRLAAAGGHAWLDLGGAARHPGLGWQDVGSQVMLGTGTCLAARWAARARSGSSA